MKLVRRKRGLVIFDFIREEELKELKTFYIQKQGEFLDFEIPHSFIEKQEPKDKPEEMFKDGDRIRFDSDLEIYEKAKGIYQIHFEIVQVMR